MPVPRRRKQDEALQIVLIEAVLEFAGKPQTLRSRERLLAKLLSTWTIRAELIDLSEEEDSAR